MSSLHEKVQAQVCSIRQELRLVLDQIHSHGIDTAELPLEDLAKLEEADQLMGMFEEAFAQGGRLLDDRAAKIDKDLVKTEFLVAYHVERLRERAAKTHGIIISSTLSLASVRCPCGSGARFAECCSENLEFLREQNEARMEELSELEIPELSPKEVEWQPISKLNMLVDMFQSRLRACLGTLPELGQFRPVLTGFPRWRAQKSSTRAVLRQPSFSVFLQVTCASSFCRHISQVWLAQPAMKSADTSNDAACLRRTAQKRARVGRRRPMALQLEYPGSVTKNTAKMRSYNALGDRPGPGADKATKAALALLFRVAMS